MIEFQDVTKRFGSREVLRGVSVAAARGRALGLIGPNGAGKTTLIKILLRLALPTSGQILVDGRPIAGDESYRARLGYMPQIVRFPERLTAAELFAMVAGLRGLPGDGDRALLERWNLLEQLHKPLAALSGGTRQKVNAALALRFDPAILVLDEPTAGLDPLSAAMLKDEIMARRDAGATVLVTSHVMSDLAELCDDVALLLDGTVRFLGPVAALTLETRQTNLERAVAAVMLQEVA